MMQDENHLKSRVYQIQIWIYLAEVMLAKLSADMLNNQVNCYMILSPTRYDDISIFFGWENKIIKCRFDKFRILRNQQSFSISIAQFLVLIETIN